MVQLVEHFARKEMASQSEWLRQQRWFIKARHDNERREKAQDRLEDDVAAWDSTAVPVSTREKVIFEVKLDSYDEATVIALMENLEQLEAVQARMDALLEQAFVIEDGRRVFKTQDGLQVFDEHGAEISATELDFALIPETAPTWETYQPELEHRETLIAERTEILEYQAKLDAAREEIEGGEISEADLEALDAELLEMMPDAVQAQLGPDHAPSKDAGQTAELAPPVPVPHMAATVTNSFSSLKM